jgi:hypothetical protein
VKLRDRVSILSAGDLAEDSHGNPVVDWENAAVKVEPAEVVPVSSSENLSAQDTVTTRWRVFLLPMTAADSSSRILWRGLTYEVDGDVELHTDSRSRPHHREALLLRVSG